MCNVASNPQAFIASGTTVSDKRLLENARSNCLCLEERKALRYRNCSLTLAELFENFEIAKSSFVTQGSFGQTA